MKSATQVLNYTRDLMARMYREPDRFARTPSELNVALLQIHCMWGYVTDRESEMNALHVELCKSDYQDNKLPDGFFDHLGNPDNEAWKLVSRHWQNVDAALGISTE
jgi:hypothetical protein